LPGDCHFDTVEIFPKTDVKNRFGVGAWLHRLAALTSATGLALLLLNGLGFLVPLRPPDVDTYRDFAGDQTLPFRVAIGRLEHLAASKASKVELVTRATHIIHEGMAHVWWKDVKRRGPWHYRLRVPASENWILFALSYVGPATYREYEFCHYAKALERGIGQCGQQAMALVSFLAAQGVETGFVGLGALHEIATAKVDDSHWYLLDADYGGVIPLGLEAVKRNPASVLPYYWSTAAYRDRIDQFYRLPTSVRYGGPEARYARACPIERLAYVLKWLIPLLLVAAGWLLERRRSIIVPWAARK
jgi:hypothetical protein